MNNFIKLIFGVCLFIVCGEFRAQTSSYPEPEKTDTFSCSIFHLVNESNVYLEMGNNSEMIRQIDSVFRYCFTWESIYSIDIKAYSSFDGQIGNNLILSKKRASFVKNYLLQTFPSLKQTDFTTEGLGENWEELRGLIMLDDSIPAKQQLIDILNDRKLNKDGKEAKIKQLKQGKTYDYLRINILPSLRKTDIKVSFKRKVLPEQPQIVDKIDTVNIIQPEVKEDIFIDTLPQPKIPEPIIRPEYWALKTNLIYGAAGVVNAGVEYPIGERLSIDVPITFSPYTIKNDWRIRTLSIQPEVRRWITQTMQGHFFGLHGHIAYYNISTDKYDRYQDKDGKTPLWGFGLTYGYAFRLKKRWNMEVAVGGGYARLNYDIFYNVNNGSLYDHDTKDYWGITRAAVNLVYLFNK